MNSLVPPDGAPILPWFEGAFSSAFIALHPFFTVDGLDPASCDYGTLVLSVGEKPDELDLIEWSDRERKHRMRGKELRGASAEEGAKNFGKSVRWSTMCRQLGLDDHRNLDHALRTHIGGLKAEFSDPIGAQRLLDYCARWKVFLPTEGSFQAIMERPLTSLLRRVGLAEVLIGDEFGEQVYCVSAEDLSAPGNWSQMQPRRIAAADQSLLLLTPWDSFFTIIVGRSEQLAGALPELFEGFWCSEETTTDWCFEPYIPLVG